MPVAVAPAVDGLFDVPHDQQRVARAGEHVAQQLFYYAPLKPARVLKLIDQHVLVADACFLQNKIRVSCLQRLAQRACRTGEQRTVRFRQITQDNSLQRSHQLLVPAELDCQEERVVRLCQLLGNRRCLRHLLRAAELARHPAETVLGGHFLRLLHGPAQPLVRRFGIAVIALILHLACIQDRLQLLHPLVVLP